MVISSQKVKDDVAIILGGRPTYLWRDVLVLDGGCTKLRDLNAPGKLQYAVSETAKQFMTD